MIYCIPLRWLLRQRVNGRLKTVTISDLSLIPSMDISQTNLVPQFRQTNVLLDEQIPFLRVHLQ